MEIQLILGKNSSGKSLYAEKLASELSSSPVYIATMVPCTEDNLARIEKHKKQRQDKNFTVYEMPFKLSEISVTPYDVVLLEDVSNLLANGIFRYSKTADDAFEEILAVARKCRTLICVNISGLSADGYDKETQEYIEGINYLNRRIFEISDLVVLMQNSEPVIIKQADM
ncbi:MAG: bifunctional adenosylcobinamide kinase/adenosylcobinamide-phosphate guanylyltransferase [Oscillospiraceae bacterium]|nr:bifunctional adenosylcobinamide kinase/adenosylcobinamide-phosphate guanylyltransferase [Oscillospiraceae bacterium]